MSISINHPIHCANWRAKNPGYGRSYYAANKEKFIQNKNKFAALRYELVNRAKTRPCADCGRQYHPFVMDLDHRPGELKIACVSQLVNRHAKIEIIEREIAKCDVVCSNCHRLRTLARRRHAHK